MIISVSTRSATTATEIEYGYSVVEVTQVAFDAGITPALGVDEVGSYLAEDGRVWTPASGFQPEVRDHDIRSARALRGSDRTLAFRMENQALAGNLVFSVSFRLLVSY